MVEKVTVMSREHMVEKVTGMSRENTWWRR
jgi:hypothetical protein